MIFQKINLNFKNSSQRFFKRFKSSLCMDTFLDYNLLSNYNFSPILSNQISIIGYNEIARSCCLNLRDNDINVKIGLNQDDELSIKKANLDGWVLGKDILSIENATRHSDIIQVLINPFDQIVNWEKVKLNISENKAIFLMNQFNVLTTNMLVIPDNIDLISISTDCSNLDLRNNFLDNYQINGQIRIIQDYSGHSFNKSIYLANYLGITDIVE